MRLTTLTLVREHLWQHRDDLHRCVIGYSGGKDSDALRILVHEINETVPLVYLGCPDCEWPGHEAHIRASGATILDSGHNWDWFASNMWAFLYSDARTAERWFRCHHRGQLRRYASERGLTLLWGNRCADGNTVPDVRYVTRGCHLWMPLRDLSDADTIAVAGKLSPVYSLQSVGGTGYVPGRLRGKLEIRRQEALAEIGGTVAYAKFLKLFEEKYCVAGK